MIRICFETIMNHKSIRKFSAGVEDEDLKKIVRAANRAPTPWNLQPLSVIIIRDKKRKELIANAIGQQEHVKNAPILIVFALDYHKITKEYRNTVGGNPNLGFTAIIEGLLSVGISAAWAGLTAEHLGYGITYIALYENPCGVADILGLPGRVVPVVGIIIGKPAESPRLRPRQPLEAFVFNEDYNPPEGFLEKVYGERVERILRFLLGEEGFYSQHNLRLLNCFKTKRILDSSER